MTSYRIILTTCGSAEEAQRIARALVERRLAACVNIVPRIESHYRWQGKVESAQEWLLVIKTARTHTSRVAAVLRELHSYELLECLELAIDGGSREYLQWMGASLKEPKPQRTQRSQRKKTEIPRTKKRRSE